MLRYEIDDPSRQPDFPRKLCAVCNVADDDLCTLSRLEFVVRILRHLILDKMLRCRGLSDIVIKSADPCEKAVRADNPACFFGELADSVRMLIRSRCPKC